MIGMTAEQFDAALMMIIRASTLLSGHERGEPVGPAAAAGIEQQAASSAKALKEFLLSAQGDGGDAIAQHAGWPSKDALIAFLYSGPSAGPVQ